MKKLNQILFAVLIAMAMSAQAQSNDTPWTISVGLNAVDFITSDNALDDGWGEQHFSDLFNVGEYWNIYAPYLSVSRLIGNNFSVGLQGSYNKVKKFPNYGPNSPDANNHGYVVSNPSADYYSADFFVKYSFMSLLKSKVIDPSLSVGTGYIFGGAKYYTVNPGAGLTFWVTKNIGLSLATSYKWTEHIVNEDNEYGTRSHFQHTAGVICQFGGKDTDKDGIYDKKDACINAPGLKELYGCPDADGDGLADKDDACPHVKGLAKFKGCLDTDSDGIIDDDDACPDVFGLVELSGCLDADGDGLADKDDACPYIKGLAKFKGCLNRY